MNGLGLALTDLAERETGTAHYAEAIKAFEDAGRVTTRAKQPGRMGAGHRYLGNALQGLGTREDGTENLEKAVKAYRASLRRTHPGALAPRLGRHAEQSRHGAVRARRASGRYRKSRRSAGCAPRRARSVRPRAHARDLGRHHVQSRRDPGEGDRPAQDGTDALENSATTYRASLEAQSRTPTRCYGRARRAVSAARFSSPPQRGEGTSASRTPPRRWEPVSASSRPRPSPHAVGIAARAISAGFSRSSASAATTR